MVRILVDKAHNTDQGIELSVRVPFRNGNGEFTFDLRRHTVHVTPKEPNWYDEAYMSEETRVKLFATILAEYRKRSIGDSNNFKGAAIGIVEDPPGEFRIFIGTNTVNQDDYFKDCAEQNMYNAATDHMAHRATRQSISADEFPTAKLKPPKLVALYMMVGKNKDPQKPNSKELLSACPCGKCTDMLAKAMPEDAPIYVLPISINQQTVNLNDAIRIDHSTKYFDKVVQGQIWKTTAGNLNAHRNIPVDADEKNAQIEGLNAALNYSAAHVNDREGDALNGAVAKEGLFQSFTPLAVIVGSTLNRMGDFVQATDSKKMQTLERFAKVAYKAAENVLLGRKSIPELDIAQTQHGIDLTAINQFMVEKINEVAASRLRSSGISPDDKAAFEAEIKSIRCCVVQLKNGTFHYAIEAKTSQDNATPNAEVGAVMAAMEKLTEARIQDVWVMEMNPRDIRAGAETKTSPKEGVERLVKRGISNGSGNMMFHYLPFNDGSLKDSELQKMTDNFTVDQIYPGGFRGNRAVGESQTIAK
ncbi:MAG: hypothetical protein J0M34_02485 [Alphaproteobacteria bacterium]|nr:hypothetical protein [Alphaproteobacteria bacterium]